MNKHVLALSTALSILAFTPAFAQNNAPAVDCTQEANKADPACMNQQQNNTTTKTQDQSGTTTDQNAQQGTTSTTTTTEQNAQTTTQGTTTQMGNADLFVPADQLNNTQLMSASDYIGKTVYDQAGNNIGDVNDLIVSGDGNVEAVILGVGGFLGIGEKDVAVNTQAVQMVQDGDNTRLVVQATKEALNNAPSYDRSNRRYANQSTTGTTTDTTGSTTAPAPAPAPADNNAATGNTSGSGTVDCTVAANANDPACVNQQQQ